MSADFCRHSKNWLPIIFCHVQPKKPVGKLCSIEVERKQANDYFIKHEPSDEKWGFGSPAAF